MTWEPKRRGKLLSRLTKWFTDEKAYPDPATLIILQHCDASTGQPMGPPAGRWAPPWLGLDILAAEIITRVEDDANEYGGVQRYLLICNFGATAEGVPISQHADLTDEDRSLTVAPSEKANSQGILAQMMRHLEVRDRTFSVAVTTVLDRLANENISLRARADADDARRIRMFELQEQLLDKQAARKIAEDKAKFQQEMFKEMASYAKVMVPIIANNLAGDKVLPEAVPPGEAIMGQFFDSLDPPVWNAMLAPLPGPQQLLLNSLLKKHLDDKEKRAGTYQGDRALTEGTSTTTVESSPQTHTHAPPQNGAPS